MILPIENHGPCGRDFFVFSEFCVNADIDEFAGPYARLASLRKEFTMLRAPELKTMNQANQLFNPDLQSAIAPTRMEATDRFVVDAASDTDADLLDAALIKNAVTVLHREEEREMQTLSRYAEAQIAEIVDDHGKFLKNQKDTAVQALKTNRQKQLFEFMTEAYFRQSLDRAKALQKRKIREFHIDAVEQQNREFLNRALAPENAVNDDAQTAYRNMILFNLENLYQDAPQAERAKALDEAAV